MKIDLPILLDDFGKPVVIGATTITGIRDRIPQRLFEDQAPVGAVQVSVLCRTADLPALAEGMAITYDGELHVLQFWEPDANALDGEWMRLYLETA